MVAARVRRVAAAKKVLVFEDFISISFLKGRCCPGEKLATEKWVILEKFWFS